LVGVRDVIISDALLEEFEELEVVGGIVGVVRRRRRKRIAQLGLFFVCHHGGRG
jgi:hypothetical protein